MARSDIDRAVASALTSAIALMYLREGVETARGAYNIYWAYSDLFINYVSGFSRRGFLGALLLEVRNGTSISAPVLVSLTYSVAAMTLVFGFSILIFRIASNLFVFSMTILSPATLMFPLNDFLALLRKETFCLGLFVICGLGLKWIMANPTKTKLHPYLAVSLVVIPTSVLAVLIWEPSGLALGIIGGITWHALRSMRSNPHQKKVTNGTLLRLTLITILPAFITLGASAIFSGTPSKSQANWQSVESWSGAKPLAIEFQASSLADALDLVSSEYVDSPSPILYFLGTLLLGPILLSLLLGGRQNLRQVIQCWILLSPVMALFIIGLDFGRWVSFAAIAASLYLATVLKDTQTTYIQETSEQLLFRLPRFVLMTVILAAYVGLWRIPHAGAQPWTEFVQVPASWIYSVYGHLPISK